MFILIWMVFFQSFQSFSEAEKIICNATHQLTLEAYETIFIESPDFPRTMDLESLYSCVISVSLSEIDENSVSFCFL